MNRYGGRCSKPKNRGMRYTGCSICNHFLSFTSTLFLNKDNHEKSPSRFGCYQRSGRL
jgi:hypothetical protein